MKTTTKELSLGLIVYFFFLTIVPTKAAILIDAQTRNGSFESGTGSPWSVSMLVNDSGFAEDGSWFAQPTATAASPSIVRDDIFQFLPIQYSSGSVLMLSFWGRVPPTNALSNLQVGLSDSTFAPASESVLLQPSLSSTGWAQFEYQFTLPTSWNDTGNALVSILMYNRTPTVGETYMGYIDNVVLEQIPEPSTIHLVLFSAIPLFIFRKTRGLTAKD